MTNSPKLGAISDMLRAANHAGIADANLACQNQPKFCPTWVGGTENFPVPPFSRQVGRISPVPPFWSTVGRIFLRRFHDTFFYEFKNLSTVRKGPHMSQFCTTAQQCRYYQGRISHLPLQQRPQQLPTMYRRHVDVADFCSNGEPSSARPLPIPSTSADAFQ